MTSSEPTETHTRSAASKNGSRSATVRVPAEPRAQPFVKWPGGKRRLASDLAARLPEDFSVRRYVEPFLGGGALYFALRPKRALLSDINRDLIDAYGAVRDELELLTAALRKLEQDHSMNAYYAARAQYNAGVAQPRAERAALFIYLNKSCFNGLYRVNRHGAFNVPCGRRARLRLVDEPAIEKTSRALHRATVRCSSFEAIAEDIGAGDFVYFDPPYAPLSPTASFTAYTRQGFSRERQMQLRDVYGELDRRGARLMLSNSDVPLIRELYRDYVVDVVQAPRVISCDGNGRGAVRELVIRNYKIGRGEGPSAGAQERSAYANVG